MGRLVDIRGRRFGRLRVVDRAGASSDNKATWECICDCGNTAVVIGRLLRCGMTRSCGCYNAEAARARATRHGMARSSEHNIWKTMISRCGNPNNKSYHRYGGRGIAVCDRWKIYENFYADMGPRPRGRTIERINNDVGYCPDNCRWASSVDQGNNKTNNRWITVGDETLTAAQWARRVGIRSGTIRARLDKGWSPDRAVGVSPC